MTTKPATTAPKKVLVRTVPIANPPIITQFQPSSNLVNNSATTTSTRLPRPCITSSTAAALPTGATISND